MQTCSCTSLFEDRPAERGKLREAGIREYHIELAVLALDLGEEVIDSRSLRALDCRSAPSSGSIKVNPSTACIEGVFVNGDRVQCDWVAAGHRNSEFVTRIVCVETP
jgi:hypothetical protein